MLVGWVRALFFAEVFAFGRADEPVFDQRVKNFAEGQPAVVCRGAR